MKKTLKIKLCLTLIILVIGLLSINAYSSKMNNEIKNEFQYKLDENNTDDNQQPLSFDSNELRLVKRTTLYLLGMQTNKEETIESYLTRKERFLNLIQEDTVPTKDGKEDKESAEYKNNQSIRKEIKALFEKINESSYKFGALNNIQIRENDNRLFADVFISNVTIIEKNNFANETESKQNIFIHYEYKKKDETYGLNKLCISKSSDYNTLFEERKNQEEQNPHFVATYKDNKLSDILNFQSCIDITSDNMNSTFEKNKNKLVTIKTNNNKGNGFFIKNNLIVTTWNYFQKVLSESEIISSKDFSKIAIRDYSDKNYTIRGIATISTDNNLVVIKTNENCEGELALKDETAIENGVISISSQTGKGFTSQKGLVISNDYYIGATIPLGINDEGSALFDKSGNVIGINTSISSDVDSSYFIKANEIIKIKDLFNGVDDVSTKSLEDIINKYFLSVNNDTEKAKTKQKWSEYKKIGKLDKTIKLELGKVSYRDKVFTARYILSDDNKLKDIEDIKNYIKQLEKQRYKLLKESDNQIIYYSNTYFVTIQKIPHYLIIKIEKT